MEKGQASKEHLNYERGAPKQVPVAAAEKQNNVVVTI